MSLKADLFNSAMQHLKLRFEPLQQFLRVWEGSNTAGFEGWLKVEFVAAISTIIPGGVKTGGVNNKTNPDLKLVHSTGEEVPVELKASSNWDPAHRKWGEYRGRILVFLCGCEKAKLNSEVSKIREKDKTAIVDELCEMYRRGAATPESLYFGVVDLAEGKYSAG